jgi:hypothetical protein
VTLLGLAEIAAHDLRQVDEVLQRNRLVESVLVVERLDGGRVGQRPLAEVRGRGIPGDQLGQDERDQSDTDAQAEARPDPSQ